MIVEQIPVRITPKMAVDAYKRISETVFPKHEPIGDELQCYPNVEATVAKFGGTIIYGWLVRMHDEGPNLDAHAVWQSPSGDLIEVSPMPNGYFAKFGFLADSSVCVRPKGGILVCKDYEQTSVYSTNIAAERCLPELMDFRAIELPGFEPAALGEFEKWKSTDRHHPDYS